METHIYHLFSACSIFTHKATGFINKSGMLTGRLIIIKMKSLKYTIVFRCNASTGGTCNKALAEALWPDSYPRGIH